MNALALADGIARYVELFRAQPPASDLETLRLQGDMTAARFEENIAPAVDRYDSYIAASGREIAVRVYDPGGEGARPGICYFHGGGFSMGSVETFDVAGAALAEATGAVVVSVHYRRLPDVDYSAAQDDCNCAFAWMQRQAEALRVDPQRIAIAGDSAGALLALATAVQACPACLLLFYGTFSMDPARPDYAASRDPLLSGERVRAYIALFERCGGRSAPIDRTDLAGLPPTHIVAAEFDPLCSEAVAFSDRLRAAGVPVSLRRAPGMIHGFLRAVGVSAPARAELSHATAVIRPFLEGRR